MNKLLALAFFCLLFAQLDSAVSSPLLEEMLELLNEYDKRESTKSLPPPVPVVHNIPVNSTFVPDDVTILHPEEPFTMVGYLCGRFNDMAVDVAVTLNNNPFWSPIIGIVQYCVWNSESTEISDALCCNSKKGSSSNSTCTVASWPGGNHIYIRGHANRVDAVSFSLTAVFHPQDSERATFIQQLAPTNQYVDVSLLQHPTIHKELTEVITMSDAQELPYQEVARLEFSFCPTKRTGPQYQVQGIVMGTDGQSSFTQYICNAWPCGGKYEHVIAYNGRQLPTNEVRTSSNADWEKIYVAIIGWGGPYDSDIRKFVGHFQFSAQQIIQISSD